MTWVFGGFEGVRTEGWRSRQRGTIDVKPLTRSCEGEHFGRLGGRCAELSLTGSALPIDSRSDSARDVHLSLAQPVLRVGRS